MRLHLPSRSCPLAKLEFQSQEPWNASAGNRRQLAPSPQIEVLMAQARSIQIQPRSDAGYVRHLFDQFSADYDTRMLGQLSYAAPQILRDLADLVMPGASARAGATKHKDFGRTPNPSNVWPWSDMAGTR